MRILGVELGTWSVKAVEMESRFRRIDILDFHEVRLPLEIIDPTETYRTAISQLLARLPTNPEKVVTSIPPAQTALRFLKVPLKQRKKVEKAFRFELEDSVPFKLEAAIVEHYVMPTKEGSEVFAAIAPEKHVIAHVEWLKSIGLDPDWLTFEGMGLANLYLTSLAAKDHIPFEEPVLLLDLGHHKTNLSIFHGNRIELFRSVAWGGASITQAIAIAQDVAPEEAERFKMTELKMDLDLEKLSSDVKEVVVASTQAFAPLLADINHSLVAFRSQYQKRPGKILITGGTSKLAGTDAFLSQSLHCPVETFHPFNQVILKEDLQGADERRFGEPLGRALVFARKSPLLFNFRAQGAGKETSLAEVTEFFTNPNIVRILKFVGAFVLVFFIHVTISGMIASNHADNAQKDLQKEFSETFRSAPNELKKTLTRDPEALKKFVDQKKNEFDQKLKMFSKNRVPMLNFVQSISGAFPVNVKVDVNLLSLDDRSFLIEGVLYEGDLAPVTEQLKKIPSFGKVTLEQNDQRFTYRGEITGR